MVFFQVGAIGVASSSCAKSLFFSKSAFEPPPFNASITLNWHTTQRICTPESLSTISANNFSLSENLELPNSKVQCPQMATGPSDYHLFSKSALKWSQFQAYGRS